MRQLNCTLLAQMKLANSAVSCNLSPELHPVSSDDACHLSCNVLAEL